MAVAPFTVRHLSLLTRPDPAASVLADCRRWLLFAIALVAASYGYCRAPGWADQVGESARPHGPPSHGGQFSRSDHGRIAS
jgi:hypothetical protein